MFHFLLSCDSLRDLWNVYMYVCMYVMILSFDVTHYVAWTTDISVKWAMNKHISGRRYEVFIVQNLLHQLNM